MSSWREFAARSASSRRLVQFISDLVYGDAASTDLVRWRETFHTAGFEAPVYARRFDEHHAHLCQPLESYAPHPGDVVIFHYTAWTETADFLLHQDLPIVLMYHNVTPPRFFEGLDPRTEHETRRGRERLGAFAARTILATAKSEYSEADLREAGFSPTSVLPFRVDFETLDRAGDVALQRQIERAGPGILAIGRVAPNKCIDDLIKVFAFLRARVAADAILYCVGAHDMLGPYHRYLEGLVRSLGLAGQVHFTGQVPNEQRGAYYRGCRALVTMSEHEGFCAPVVEAMHLGLPVVAFASTAIPEVVADAGILIQQKQHDVIAEALALVMADTPLRRRLVQKGRANALRYAPDQVEERFAQQLSAALG